MQLDLFDHVAKVYVQHPEVPNETLYVTAAGLAGIEMDQVNSREPVGKDGKACSVIKRKMRWHQQTLKKMGLLERVGRGTWRLTEQGKQRLRKAEPTVAMLGFSTDLGIAVWGACERVFGSLDEPITLCVTSPPYLLRKPRAYGNPKEEREYVDFICRSIEPVVRNLVSGGSICLNISNDVFEPGSPARSMYCERLLLALHDRLGLQLMDRLVWENPSKPPAPIQWASIKRVQLNVAYEIVYWLTNDPARVRSDNRRVLQAHTDKHITLINGGGCQSDASYCDGAYTIRAGKSFANKTAGRIPRNILKFSHNCADKKRLIKVARDLGLPIHGATMPLSIAKFLINFLTGEGDDELVADPFGGWFRTGRAAEELGRRWISCDNVVEYVRGGAEGFRDAPGFILGAGFSELGLQLEEGKHV